MREMRPLLLPKLVAARQSIVSLDIEGALASSPSLTHSRDSSTSTTPDSASVSPLTTSLSSRLSTYTRDQARQSNLNSPSRTRASSSCDNVSTNSPSTKLCGVLEEPSTERETFMDIGDIFPCLCVARVCTHRKRSITPMGGDGSRYYDVDYDLSDGSLSEEIESGSRPTNKRRRSGDSPLSGMSTRFGNRFPSLSRRWNRRKVAVSNGSNGPLTPAPSRSASLSSQQLPSSQVCEVQLPPTPTASVHEHDMEVDDDLSPETNEEELPEDPIDRKALASTPLLPPVLSSLRTSEDTPLRSPLQSPTVAEPCSPLMTSSPAPTPRVGGLPSPPLSTKPSVSSFHRTAASPLPPLTDAPSFLVADPDDEWAIKLGHANFTIHPEPYVPLVCDRDTCRQLFEDWEQARCNFTKHQVRTGEHFGVTSNTYRLTEQKWARIDAQWKRNNDLAISRAASIGQSPAVPTPAEPAPVVKMPSFNDPECGGKFPGLGDEDIVGPMVQIASQIQPRPSKKSVFLKFLSDIKFPGSLLGRSPTSPIGVCR